MNILMVGMGNLFQTSGYGNRVLTESEIISNNNNVSLYLFAIDQKKRFDCPDQRSLDFIKKIKFSEKYFTFYRVKSLFIFSDLFRTVKSLRKLIIEKNIEVIHAQSTIAAFISILANKGLNKKIIYDMHGVPVEEHEYKGERIKAFLFRRIESYVFDKIDAVICVSRPLIKYIEKQYLFDGKFLLVPCCFDEKTFFYNEQIRRKVRIENNLQNKIVLNYTGSISKWADPYSIINYYKKMKKIIPSLFLLIVSQNEREFKEILKGEIPGNDYLLFSGTQERVNEYMNASDIGLLFRERHVLNEVSFPTKYAEYIGAGLPVISSVNIGHIDEYTKKLNFVNEEDSVSKQAAKILEVKENRDYWADSCTLLAKEQLTWSIYGKKIIKLYEHLLY